jgi:hypothetical protein
MIAEALNCVKESLNTQLKSKLPAGEERVIISGLINQDGSSAVNGDNKLLLTLVGVEQDISQKIGITVGGNFSAKKTAPVSLNLFVMVSAYFSSNNYEEALRFLSFAISFFQQKNVFTPENTPEMDARLHKLTFEIENCGFDKINNIWATLGAKYVPSIIYKVRMITFNSDFIREFRPRITGLNTNI